MPACTSLYDSHISPKQEKFCVSISSWQVCGLKSLKFRYNDMTTAPVFQIPTTEKKKLHSFYKAQASSVYGISLTFL